MKDEFFGFYEPSQEEINNAWETGTFIFDANALLNLYRYTDSTRKDFLLVLKKLSEKLFMPYQVGYEYHTNRLSVIDAMNNSYNTLIEGIKEILEKQIKSQLNKYKRHPSIEVDKFSQIEANFLSTFEIELNRQKENHPDFNDADEVLNVLTELYKGKVGNPYLKDDLKKVYAEGKERYDQLIPPGYKDLEAKKRKGEQNVYGDLIIWKQIINRAKTEKKSIIFITDDRKDDWWTIENGRTIRPREELIKEFYDLTKIRILIYNADNFLHYAKERNLVAEIKDRSITEIKEVREEEENYIVLNNFANSNPFALNEALQSSIRSAFPVTSSLEGIMKSDLFKSVHNIPNFGLDKHLFNLPTKTISEQNNTPSVDNTSNDNSTLSESSSTD